MCKIFQNFFLTCEPNRYQHDHADSDVDQLGQNHLTFCLLRSFCELFFGGALAIILIPISVWKGRIQVFYHMQKLLVCVLIFFEFCGGEYFDQQYGQSMEYHDNKEN